MRRFDLIAAALAAILCIAWVGEARACDVDDRCTNCSDDAARRACLADVARASGAATADAGGGCPDPGGDCPGSECSGRCINTRTQECSVEVETGKCYGGTSVRCCPRGGTVTEKKRTRRKKKASNSDCCLPMDDFVCADGTAHVDYLVEGYCETSGLACCPGNTEVLTYAQFRSRQEEQAKRAEEARRQAEGEAARQREAAEEARRRAEEAEAARACDDRYHWHFGLGTWATTESHKEEWLDKLTGGSLAGELRLTLEMRLDRAWKLDIPAGVGVSFSDRGLAYSGGVRLRTNIDGWEEGLHLGVGAQVAVSNKRAFATQEMFVGAGPVVGYEVASDLLLLLDIPIGIAGHRFSGDWNLAPNLSLVLRL